MARCCQCGLVAGVAVGSHIKLACTLQVFGYALLAGFWRVGRGRGGGFIRARGGDYNFNGTSRTARGCVEGARCCSTRGATIIFQTVQTLGLTGRNFQQRPKCSAFGLPYVALLIGAARCTHAATTGSDLSCVSLRRCALNDRWIADRGVVAAAAQINNCSCSAVANQHVWGRHSNSKQYLWRAG